MLRCPKCNRTYENDAQKFCTRDGGRLIVVETETPGFNPNATMVSQPSFDPNKTVVSQLEPPFDSNKPNTSQPQPLFDPNKTAVSEPPVRESAAQSQPPVQQPETARREIFQTLPSVSVDASSQAAQSPVDQPLKVVPIVEEENFDATAPSIPYQQNASQSYGHEQQQPSHSQIPMPARYDQTSPTATDLNYPSNASSSTQANAGYSPSATPPPVEAQYTSPVEARYTSQTPIEPSSEFQGGYDASFGQTVNYGPQSYAGQNVGYQNVNAEPETIPAQHSPTPTLVVSRAAVAAAPPKKKSNKLLFIGLGAVFFAFLIVVVGIAGFVIVTHPEWIWGETPSNVDPGPRGSVNNNANTTPNANANNNANTNVNANTDTVEPPPPNSTRFENSSSELSGDLAAHFAPFSFYYPQSWSRTPNPGGYFVEVIRKPDNFPQEYFAVGYYNSKGTMEADRADFERLVKEHSAVFAKQLQGYQKLSEEETTINKIQGYEFKFSGKTSNSEKGDVTLFGRMVFLPPNKTGEKNGVTLVMYGTSLAPEVQSMDDVGTKGELPMILKTFKLGQ